MKTIEEHNAEIYQLILGSHKTGLNVECPNCKAELRDSWPGTVLACDPPRRSVICDACGYQGSILA